MMSELSKGAGNSRPPNAGPRPPFHRAAVVILLAVFAGGPALAHDPGLSYLTLIVDGAGRLSAHMTLAAADVRGVDLESLARGALEIHTGDEARLHGGPAVDLDASLAVHIRLRYALGGEGPLRVRSAVLERLPPGHRQYVSVRRGDGTLILDRLLAADAAALEIPTADRHDADPGTGTFLRFLVLGAEHILAGYDHLLFLLALLMTGCSAGAAVRLISCFTVAHAATLALTALHVASIPAAIVEPAIALSIVYVGFESLFRRETAHRWMVVFAFGLIHGFGFAAALRELNVAAGERDLLLRLFSFNLGIELGHLAVAALVLPLFWQLKSRRVWTARGYPVAAATVMAIGLYWFVERLG